MDDIRQAFRSIRQQPGFAAVAVLTLAFGISVNVTLFGMLSAFYLQPLPVKQPDRLVFVLQRGDVINMPYGHSYPDYLDYRAGAPAFADVVAFSPEPAHISARGRAPERTWVEVVSPNYFAMAGVSPAFGEFPSPEPLTGHAAPTVVLSHAYWLRRFGGDPSIVGRLIAINGRGFTVSGIAPASFSGLSWAMAVSAWVPAGAMGALRDGGDSFRDNRNIPAWRVLGRLAPGRTIDEARAEVEVVGRRLATEYPAEHKGTRPLLVPENRARPDPSVAGFLPIFAAVFAAMVALVLLIACANVANLTLSRAFARQRDLVIRSALGASRFRLVRLQVVETVMLAGIAGVIGFALSQWAGRALAGFAPSGDIPVNQNRPWDWRPYAFAFAISVLTGVIAGFWPARKATQFDVAEALKEGGATAGSPRHTLRNLLVISQVTFSIVVLASAGLFVRSLRQMQNASLGFKPDGLLMMSIDLGLQQYGDERGRAFLEELQRRIETLPGVVSAAAASRVPFDYGMQFADVSVDGGIPGSKEGSMSIGVNAVGTDYLETIGTAIVQGRAFQRTDDHHARRVAVVNEIMARKLWPGRNPLGQRFRVGGNTAWTEVVGVAADGKYVMIAEQPRPYFYVPLSQQFDSPLTIMVRSASDPATLAAPVRKIVNAMDPDLPVFNVRTMDAHLRQSLFALMPLRVGAWMAGVQGLIALLLAVTGLYAVISYTVARRSREIGVRMALGANAVDVVRLVVREGMWMSVIGIAIGVSIAFGVGAVLSAALYGVRALDGTVFAAAIAVLLGVSALACYVPARRATRVDPLTALRCG